MKILEKYNDYLLDIILESIKLDETALILSDRLKTYLKEIKEHPIAEKILYDSNDYSNNMKFKITLLDIVDKKDTNGNDILDLISFTQSNKALENTTKNLNYTINKDEKISTFDYDIIISNMKYYFYNDDDEGYLGNKNRTEAKLGKIINKLYPGEFKASGDPGNDIESFVNKYKALRDIETTFELVNGDDIVYWYNVKNYGKPIQGALYHSCMRYDKCGEYLDFYAKNPDKVSMLILKDPKDDTKIIGRALVWEVSKIGDTDLDEPRHFMDRIFYTNEYIIDVFKKYARENGWLYKFKQNMNENEKIIDSKTEENVKTVSVFNINDTGIGHYPFLDTLCFFDYNKGVLSNSTNDFGRYYSLTNTNGSADSAGNYWSDYYDEYINIDDYIYCEWSDDYRDDYDCFWSEYYGVNVANDYADVNGEYCDYPLRDSSQDNWRKKGDYVELSNGKTSTSNYAREKLKWSDYSDEYLVDFVWSDYHKSYINSDYAVIVYLNPKHTQTDWRVNDDNTWFEWNFDNDKYDRDDVTIEELEKLNGLSDDNEE